MLACYMKATFNVNKAAAVVKNKATRTPARHLRPNGKVIFGIKIHAFF
jgi:hypothetical protein